MFRVELSKSPLTRHHCVYARKEIYQVNWINLYVFVVTYMYIAQWRENSPVTSMIFSVLVVVSSLSTASSEEERQAKSLKSKKKRAPKIKWQDNRSVQKWNEMKVQSCMIYSSIHRRMENKRSNIHCHCFTGVFLLYGDTLFYYLCDWWKMLSGTMRCVHIYKTDYIEQPRKIQKKRNEMKQEKESDVHAVNKHTLTLLDSKIGLSGWQ